MIESIQAFFGDYELFFKIVTILVFTVILARIINRAYKKFLTRSAEKGNINLTTYKFLEHSLSVIIYLIGISFAISLIEFLKPLAQSIVAGAGILAIAVGFAAQQALGNIISGIFIVISKPYQIKDRISMQDGLRGVVEDISLRHTVIRNFENQRIIIPNSVMSEQILTNSNYTDDKICRLINIGISYDSDIDLAKKIMTEEIINHPFNFDNRTEEDIENGLPRVIIRLVQLGDSSVVLRAWAWAKEPLDAFFMECDVLESIKKRFDKAGITIPFPQRTISYLKSESGTSSSDESPS